MPDVMSNKDLAAELRADPGGQRLVVFAYAPVDVNVVPDDAAVVPMRTWQPDWPHIIECQVVLAHDGQNTAKPLRAAERCLRFHPWELLMWNVITGGWVCVKDGAGKWIGRVPGIW